MIQLKQIKLYTKVKEKEKVIHSTSRITHSSILSCKQQWTNDSLRGFPLLDLAERIHLHEL